MTILIIIVDEKKSLKNLKEKALLLMLSLISFKIVIINSILIIVSILIYNIKN